MSDLELRQERFALDFGLTLAQYKKLASSLGHTDLISCLELLKARRFRSKTRKQAQEQILQWLEFGTDLKPLSANQLKMIAPTWPIKFQIPT